MKVRYTPSTAGGTYDLDLTEIQWDALKANPDYQLLSADDIAKMQAPPVPVPVPVPEAAVPPPAVDSAGTVAATA